MRDIAQKGSFGTASPPKGSELGSSANGATRILNKVPAAKFFLSALRIVVKLANAKAHDVAVRLAFDGVKYANAFWIILAAQARIQPRWVVALVCGIIDLF